MPSKPSHKEALGAWIAQYKPEVIGEAEAAQIQQVLAPVSASYLHKLLRECGAPLAPMVDGVRQSSINELEDTLLALIGEYAAGDSLRRKQVRQVVITAKDHARLAMTRTKDHEARALKQEALLWMTTWLENPLVFADWVALRRAQLQVL